MMNHLNNMDLVMLLLWMTCLSGINTEKQVKFSDGNIFRLMCHFYHDHPSDSINLKVTMKHSANFLKIKTNSRIFTQVLQLEI